MLTPPADGLPVLPAWHHLTYRVRLETGDDPEARDDYTLTGAAVAALYPHLAPLLEEDSPTGGTALEAARDLAVLRVEAQPDRWRPAHTERRPGAAYCTACEPQPPCPQCGAAWNEATRAHATHDPARHLDDPSDPHGLPF